MDAPLLDAVVFDLDGTLVATDRFWLPAARTGCARAFEELGLEREPPAPREWLSLLGLPFGVGLARVLPDLDAAQRRLVGERVQAEQDELLAAGPAFLLPGVEAVLEELAARGVAVGVASNCSADYLAAVVGGSPVLASRVEEARCLSSPGVADKADMVRDLLATFDTRRAVMVGDRAVDAEAARASTVPFVHCAYGFAPEDEAVTAEARIGRADELLAVLAERPAVLRGLLEELLPPGPAGAETALAVTGAPGAGASLLAADVLALAEAEGRPLRRVETAGLVRDGLAQSGAEDVAPAARRALETALGVALDAGPVLVEGRALLGRGLDDLFGASLYVDVPEEVGLERLAALERAGLGEEEPRARWDAERALRGRGDPRRAATRVVSGENPLRPTVLAPRGA